MKKSKSNQKKSNIIWHIGFKSGFEAGFVRGQENRHAKRGNLARGFEVGLSHGRARGESRRADIASGYQAGKKQSSAWVKAKKQAIAGRSFADGYQTGKKHGHKLAIRGKTATKKGAKIAVGTVAMPIVWAQAGATTARAKTTTKAHRHLERKLNWYAAHHQHKHHKKIHLAMASFHSLVYVAIGLVVFMSAVGPARAYSTWNQTDWSGGLGGSTANQFSSASGVETSTAGQVSLPKTQKLTNGDFAGNLNGWDGMNKLYNGATYRNGAGSAKVTVPAPGASIFGSSNAINGGGTGMTDIKAADLNGDGYKDMVATSWNGNLVSVYINNGDGTFASVVNYSVASSANVMDIGDLNGDGYADIVTTAWGYCKISILTNNGNGTFGPKNDITYSGACDSGRISDVELFNINNDQSLDILISERGEGGAWSNIHILQNNGNGTFAPESIFLVGAYVGGQISQCDLNNDGKKDIVVSSSQANFKTALGNGTGFATTVSHTTSTAASSLDCGDVNGDGYADVVVTNGLGGGGVNRPILLYLNTGGNSFGSAVNIDSSVNSSREVRLADINGDGKLDEINGYFSGTWVYNAGQYRLGNGDGTFGSVVSFQSNSGTIRLSDLNSDGKVDLFGIYSSNQISYQLNTNGGNALTQNINAGDSSTYYIEAYAYTTGAAVTSADAELFYNGSAVATTYTDAGGGWYRLRGSVTGANEARAYGAQAKPSKTVYFDDVSVYKYPTSGSLTSNVFDLGYGGDWGNLSFATSGQGTVAVKVRSSNDANMSGAPAFSACPAIASGTDLTGSTCVTNNHRYVQYDITLTPGGHDTPILSDLSIDYLPWDNTTPASNASSLAMKRTASGDTIASNGWTNNQQAYFSWTAGADDIGGSGIKGYCAYLGQTASADPISTKGLLGNSPVATSGECQFIVSGTSLDLATITGGTAMTTSSSPYYLNLKAVDVAGNVYSGSSAQFQFKFDNTPPANPSFVTAPSQFINTKATTITWPSSGGDGPSDAESGVSGLQYKIGNSTWYGDSHSGAQDASDLLVNDGSYATQSSPDFANIAEGNNIIYFRTWDTAGNVSLANVTTVLKVNISGAPSSPQNVTATPSNNTINSFAFSWLAPSSYIGQADKITYCYTVNSTPTVNNCTYTATGVTSLPAGAYATQPGDNTFYVVAKDESGNINYATVASTTFTANTSAPGMPLNIDIADTSVKATSNWRLSVNWEAPTNVGAGVASYRIFRSGDNANFTQVATTAGTSYSDSGLTEQIYYYKVKACDSANNCGADSAVVHELPTGKFTTSAELVSLPKIESLSTRKTTISWVTDRGSDSRISYGTASGSYFATEAASSEQVTSHKIELNGLTAGTTYYYKAKWVDGDGNVGQSAEYSFTTAPSPSCRDVSATKIGLIEATLQITCKDSSKIKVLYGKSEQFGGQAVVNTSTSDSTYNVPLTGLDDGTKYSYKLNTYDGDGNEYEGAVTFSFTTPARPRISNLRFQPVEGEPTSTQKVTWTTNVPATSSLNYGKVGSAGSDVTDSKLAVDHEMIIRELEDSSEYFLVATSRDAIGNQATSDRQVFQTALDTRPPKLTKITVEPSVKGTGTDARGQLIVSWHTDEPATSQVSFDDGKGGSTTRTNEDAAMVTDHVVVVSDLSPAQVYSIIAISRDKAGNSVQSTTQSAIVGRASDSIFAIIFNALQQIFGLSSK